MVPAAHARVVLSTATSLPEAQTIARVLVEEQLAACVNILPGACSIYRWQGVIHQDEESVLLIKTAAGFGDPSEAAPLRRSSRIARVCS
jgi:periplasmic divalent cation tolerance protein